MTLKTTYDESDKVNSIKTNYIFFESRFLISKYFHFIIPAIYFVIMLFVSVTNRAIGDYGVESDFYSSYIPQAKEILNGNIIIDPFKGPLYQIFLAVTGFVFGRDYFLAGKFLNVISAGVALYFVSKLIGSILNREAAFITVLIIAVNYIFLTYTYTPNTDILFLVFYISALYFILKNEILENKNLFIAGLLTSFAYLTRYTAISLIIFAVFVFVLNLYKWSKKNKSEEKISPPPIKPILFYFIPVIILTSVWGIISYNKTGFFFYNLNYQNTSFTVHKPENMSKYEWNEKYKDSFNSMSDVVLKDVGTFGKIIFLNNFPNYFKKDLTRLLPKYFGLFVVIGLVFFLIKFKSQIVLRKYFFLANFLFYLQILLIFYAERFSIPLLPFYCFLIVWLFSIDQLQRFNFKIAGIKFFGFFLFVLIIFNLYNSIKSVKREINVGPTEILTIKNWVDKNNVEDVTGKLIMGRKPHIAYYLDMKFQVIPFVNNLDEFFKNVKDNNVDYIYISEKEADYLTEANLKQILLNYKNPPNELEIVTYTESPIAILYKVKK